jgi:hypothetical protein
LECFLVRIPGPKGGPSVAFFYEIRSTDNTALKRDGGFPTQDAANCRTRRRYTLMDLKFLAREMPSVAVQALISS